MRIEFKNGQESFGMSGPWLGDLFINNVKLKGKFLVDNQVTSEDNRYFIFSKYYEPKEIKFLNLISFTSNNRVFKIFVFDTIQNIFYEEINKHRALYIEGVSENLISFHNAFHNKMTRFLDTILFNDVNFIIKKESEVFY